MVQLVEAPGALIPRFYAGRCVFITGATGFMGKVLIERLLSTCPDIGQLFLLVRGKKNQSPEDRLQQLKHSQVFDQVRQANPRQLDKLRLVAGDVTRPALGLTPESRAMLQEVSVVFHSAATVKLNEPLRVAVEQNLRSVLRLLEVTDALPDIAALVYVSTAYSNSEHHCVQERVYPPPAPLAELLALVDSAEPQLDALTSKYISPKPNTYTFTKAMAEYALQQHGTSRYPVAIFRPTIVVSSLRHPFPGWIENLNGPSGVIAGAGTGIMRVIRSDSSARADMLPVDIAIDTLLAVAWETAVDKVAEVRVYNCSTAEHPVTWGRFGEILHRSLRETPLDNAVWYPHVVAVPNKFAHKALEMLLQTVPLYLLEYTTRLLRVKTHFNLISVNHKLQAMDEALSFFALREWRFENGNVRRLRSRLTPADAALYNLDPRSIDWERQLGDFVRGTRRYALQQGEHGLPDARKRVRRLRALYHGAALLSCLLALRLALRSGVAQALLSALRARASRRPAGGAAGIFFN